MLSFLRFIRGFYRIKISGYSPERFFNICRSRKIPLYAISTQVTEKGTCYVAKMRLKDYLRIRPTAKKAHCIPYVRKRLGVPFFVKKYRKQMNYSRQYLSDRLMNIGIDISSQSIYNIEINYIFFFSSA